MNVLTHILCFIAGGTIATLTLSVIHMARDNATDKMYEDDGK